MKKFINRIAVTVAAAALVTGIAVSPAAATPVETIRPMACKTTYEYIWWNPICWNLGYGVPGGLKGPCYIRHVTC